MIKETLYKGRVITLNREHVILPNGRETAMEVIRHPGGVVIAAVNDRQQLCMIYQYRHSVGQWIWEVPAGTLTPGESPQAAAARELTEETGVKADQLALLAECHPAPGFCDELLHIYHASGLSQLEQSLDDDECIEVHWVDLSQAIQWARDGTIRDAKTMVALFHLTQTLGIIDDNV